MALFGKRVVVYRVQGDKPAWKAARETLTSAGIKIMESGSYDGEMPICGCGAKIDRSESGWWSTGCRGTSPPGKLPGRR